MDGNNLKSALGEFKAHLQELEDAARKLKNQNFADIVASAKGRVHQLSEHPDVDAVAEHMSGPEPFHPDEQPPQNGVVPPEPPAPPTFPPAPPQE